ncbi:MAG: IS5 family transposase [Lentisphaeria bacterium]|nr:IS5 family transposase [Lentisphaeria bacterium]
MYKATSSHQITFHDFNQSCGMSLDMGNEWCRLAHAVDWAAAERLYKENFPSRTRHPAFPVRMALGALVIQKRMKLSDRALVKAVAENPYYQYFIGLESFAARCPFTYSTLAGFRKRLAADVLMKINESFLETAAPTPEHGGGGRKPEQDGPEQDGPNAGTAILDATCSPSNIRCPQDFSLLDEAGEKLELMIDGLHRQLDGKSRRPRTYRRVMRKAYLGVTKAKSRPAKKVRALIYKELCTVKRNLAFMDAYLAHGGSLTAAQAARLGTIRELYRQQKEMFDERKHRVDARIVSVSQPYIRPIVRGKVRAPIEFGAKYDVSVDEKGHARLEKLSFDAYNECGVLQDTLGRYKERTGHYPLKVLVDRIYRTKENRDWCRSRGICMSGRGPGRPKAGDGEAKREEHRDDLARNEVKRFFSREKRTCSTALVVAKLACTTLASIALSVFVANRFGVPPAGGDFLLSIFRTVPKLFRNGISASLLAVRRRLREVQQCTFTGNIPRSGWLPSMRWRLESLQF